MYSHWNNRVIRHEDKEGETLWYGVHEVFYENGKPCAYAPEPSSLVGETEEDIEAQVAMIAKDLRTHKTLDAKSMSSKANSMHPDTQEIWKNIGMKFYRTISSGWSIASPAYHESPPYWLQGRKFDGVSWVDHNQKSEKNKL
jgi:hypothetical protein